jgi:hypothetical protein
VARRSDCAESVSSFVSHDSVAGLDGRATRQQGCLPGLDGEPAVAVVRVKKVFLVSGGIIVKIIDALLQQITLLHDVADVAVVVDLEDVTCACWLCDFLDDDLVALELCRLGQGAALLVNEAH